jgi:sugar lactone lactonase YvrE
MTHRLIRPSRAVLALCALAAAGACRASQAAEAPAAARMLARIEGFGFPESVRYDPDQDLYFVSNMAGPGSLEDGNGFIARVPASSPDRAEVFIQGGRDGVVLDAPKGMALRGDTLWVADIHVLRGFHRRTGAPLATIDLRAQRPQLLNDVAVGPDGSLHVTDTGIAMTDKGVIYQGGDRVFRIGPDRAVSTIASGAGLGRPNGITWDPDGERWIVVSFDPFRSEVYAIRPGDSVRTILARGTGKFDGVERLADGRLLVTSWTDSAVMVVDGQRVGRMIRGLWQPADLGVDTRRGRVAVPLALQGRVEIWTIPERPGNRE